MSAVSPLASVPRVRPVGCAREVPGQGLRRRQQRLVAAGSDGDHRGLRHVSLQLAHRARDAGVVFGSGDVLLRALQTRRPPRTWLEEEPSPAEAAVLRVEE